ncbi:GTP cyclohydrolase II RibA [Nocardia tengchongensis]|uniref:GTP cyclohydrolase II RibA n=1 Tax=Nocardia tengchongensis TaxID=2055889 RepID=UPI0036BB2A4A
MRLLAVCGVLAWLPFCAKSGSMDTKSCGSADLLKYGMTEMGAAVAGGELSAGETPRAKVRSRVPVVLRRGVECVADLVTFENLADPGEHVAFVFPAPYRAAGIPLVRVHSECLTGDLLGCDRCQCGGQLQEAVTLIAARGGAILYLRQEGRGIGLYNKVDAYVLQDVGYDTFEANRLLGRGADERTYRMAAQMLSALGLDTVELLTNNPDKVRQLRAEGIEIASVRRSEPDLLTEPHRFF